MTNVLAKLQSVFAALSKYGQIAITAVHQVEAEVGPSNGATKKQLAVAYVLAAAHAGEAVTVPIVAEVSAAVEMAAGIANALGLFGKPPAPSATVAVPAATQAATA